MKERPILFSAPMVRAILEGRKAQTRRIIKPKPVHNGCYLSEIFCPGDKSQHGKYEWVFQSSAPFSAPFKPGMRLWVRETWMPDPAPCCDGSCDCRNAIYRADIPGADLELEKSIVRSARRDGTAVPPWKSPVFMPRWASRITLEVTDVRVERLQEISEADALAEGIDAVPKSSFPLLGKKKAAGPFWKHYANDRGEWCCSCPIVSYKTLWESIHGPGSWELNPWVFAVSFKRVEGQP